MLGGWDGCYRGAYTGNGAGVRSYVIVVIETAIRVHDNTNRFVESRGVRIVNVRMLMGMRGW